VAVQVQVVLVDGEDPVARRDAAGLVRLIVEVVSRATPAPLETTDWLGHPALPDGTAISPVINFTKRTISCSAIY
jgi:hypothetical protein